MTQDNKEIDIRFWIIRILKNWYWFVLSCAIFGAIGIYKYVTTTKKFKVDAHIMIRTTEESFSQVDIMDVMGMGNSKKTADEVELLLSRDIMLQVIDELELHTEYRKLDKMKWMGQYPHRDLTIVYPPTFLDTTRFAVNLELKVRKEDYIVKVQYGRWWWNRSRHKVKDITKPFETCATTIYFDINNKPEIEVGDKYRLTTLPRLSLVEMYKSIIEAKPLDKESNVISVVTTTDMPARARDFIQKEIDLYNLDAVIDKNIMASNTAIFIDERLRLIEEELSAAEANVEQYKSKNGIVSLSEESELLVRESISYRKRIEEMETQLNLIQFVSDFIADDTKKNSLIPSNIGLSNEALIQLINQYNGVLLKRMRVQRTAIGDNPLVDQIDSQLALLRENLEASIKNLYSSLSISKNDLNDRYVATLSQREDIPSQERQYIEVLRNKELKEQLYLYLYKQREENALMLASAVMPAKIIAKPQMNPTPVGPRLKLFALVCLFFGLCVPLIVMIAYDIMNNRISNDSKELEKQLKVPLGGVLVQNHHGGHIAVRDGVNSASAELFRSLRTNIGFMIPSAHKKPIILVTSSINGEGKSYVATNLALSLSLLNKKVVLVGLDIRKPMLAEYMGLPNNGCLTSYLADESYSIKDLVVPTEFANLSIIPAGIIPPNPSELLQSERLDNLMEELRNRYDYVIVDSAPVAMVSDTFLLRRIADLTVYVCRAQYTTFDHVDFLNQVSDQKRLPNIVAVLNGVNANKMGYGYGYGYGYGSDHSKR